ncbi:MAG: T9SS type A sorting domain-containing protein, partial [Elusimicrobiota bacterium]
RDVADGLAIGTDGMSVFVLAKTSETGSGFMTRLFCFYDGGVTGNCGTGWATPIPLTADGSPFLDAAFSVAPDGTIWVVESATGRTLQYSQAGLLLKKTQLPGAGGTRYIGSVLAAANGDLYVAGSDGLKAWVAKYSVGDPPPRYACQAYNFPNPFNSNTARTNIRYVLPEAVSVTIDIYDLLGRPVNSWGFAAGERGGRAGMNDNLTWEGQDSSGRKVMSGMYLARLSTKPNVCTQVIRIGVLH